MPIPHYSWLVVRESHGARPRAEQTTFLVMDDYGTGGIWMYIHAQSAAQITERYPRLKVFTGWLDWMTPDRLIPIIWNLSAYDIDHPTGYLAILEAKRGDGGRAT